MSTLIALIHRSPEAYGVSFPDLPGCIAQGETLDKALADAADAVTFHVEGMVEGGEDIPVPRPLDALRANPEFREEFETADLVAAVPLTLPGKAVRVNLTFDEHLLNSIDRAAEKAGMTRSGFLADLVRARLRA
ncbi:MAG TPA: type II toxin-antitoxin system HicB family antitoxin [Hyphomicrobium sp.]|nr:type II toxin-antitoxin system HicB family antitoxin [Hyphomicrobium sp.]